MILNFSFYFFCSIVQFKCILPMFCLLSSLLPELNLTYVNNIFFYIITNIFFNYLPRVMTLNRWPDYISLHSIIIIYPCSNCNSRHFIFRIHTTYDVRCAGRTHLDVGRAHWEPFRLLTSAECVKIYIYKCFETQDEASSASPSA